MALRRWFADSSQCSSALRARPSRPSCCPQHRHRSAASEQQLSLLILQCCRRRLHHAVRHLLPAGHGGGSISCSAARQTAAPAGGNEAAAMDLIGAVQAAASIIDLCLLVDDHISQQQQQQQPPPPEPSMGLGTQPSGASAAQQHGTTQEPPASGCMGLSPQLCISISIALAKKLQKQEPVPERHAAAFQRTVMATATCAAAWRHELGPRALPWVVYCLALLLPEPLAGVLQQQLRRPAQQLAAAALPLLQQLSVDGTSRLLWSLGRLQLQPPEQWMVAAVGRVHLRLEQHGRRHMLRVLEALAELGYCPSLPLLHDLVGQLQNRIARMRPGEAAALAAALGQLGYSPKRTWLAELLVKSRSKLSGCSAPELADFAAGLLCMGCVPDPYWADAFLAACSVRLSTCSGAQVAQLLYCASTCKMDPPEGWVDLALKHSRQRSKRAEVGELQLAQLLYGCMTLRKSKVVREHVPWLRRAIMRLQQAQLQQLPPRHLAELLIAMAHFRAIPSLDWLQAYQQAAQQQLSRYSANDLAVTLAGASQLKLRAMQLVLTTAWLVELIRAVAARAAVASQDELAMAVAGLATIQVCQQAAGQELSVELELLLEDMRTAMARWSMPQLSRFNRELIQYSKSAFPAWYQQLAQHSRRLLVSKA